ncbi:MAG: trehalose-6-phosphate synthase [Actinomycetota bacterium]|nr:trehalose-6-phosphate synthase [Actinomycetota bacterium]
MSDRPLVVVSNRGPLSFRWDGDQLVGRRGAGGLVSGIAPLVAGTSTIWIAAAMSDADRAASSNSPLATDGFRVQLLDLDPADYRLAYDVVCNATLWFAHHGLWGLAREPSFDSDWAEAWKAYERINAAFADAVAATAPPDAAVLVQDYHLTLVGGLLANRRPDLRTVHFSHTPFATPDWLGVLPSSSQRALLEGMAGYHACGFHTERWADAFGDCCDVVLGVRPRTFVSPLAPDADDIRAVGRSPACATAMDELDAQIGGCKLVARVDRIELSKNLLRGFRAYDELLATRPEWRERVVFAAFVYPSRQGLESYAAYRREAERCAADINERWGTPGWRPVLYDDSDDFPRSVAALRRFDALLVNPIRDGLNLVAAEGVLVNERSGALILSTEAGIAAQLGDLAIMVNPFDISGTADALHRALTMSPDERTTQAGELLAVVSSRTPADWLADQVRAADS